MVASGISDTERTAVTSLGMLYAFRMLGLFMVLPILALYTEQIPHSTPLMIGIALGIYGLTQALLQIPFGLLSDRIGRKPMIYIGLVLFAVGSVVAALSDSIYGIIFGRLLQGAGAIASTLMALLADLTQEQNRTKAMATIGVSVGVSFGVAVVLGPLIDRYFGLSAIFWLTALLALMGLAVCRYWVPDPPPNARSSREVAAAPALIRQSFYDTQLLRLNFGIFSLHFVLMAGFVVFPWIISDALSLPGMDHWKVYLPILVLSFIAMLPFIIIAETKRQVKRVLIGAVLVGAFALGCLAMSYQSGTGVLFSLFIFFMAFNLLEATLPSLVSKVAFAGGRGTAMGVYSTSQFIGAFAGGVTGGYLAQYHGTGAVLSCCACFFLVWAWVAWTMAPPRYLTGRVLALSKTVSLEGLEHRLLDIPGVEEVQVDQEQHLAYLKIDPQIVELDAFTHFE